MLRCTKAEGEAAAPAPIGPSITERRHRLLLPGELGARVSGTKATASPVSFLPSRHCGLWKGPPHVLGLRGAGGAAVFVGQGKMGGCHIDSLACLSCHLSSWHRGLFLPFLRRPGTPLLSFLLLFSVTHLVPEARLHPSSQVTLPRSRDKLGSFWLRDFVANQNRTRRRMVEEQTWGRRNAYLVLSCSTGA